MGATSVPLYAAFYTWRDFLFMVQGAGITLILTLISGTLGTLVGFLIGWARSVNLRIIGYPLGGYIDVIRSVPLIIQFILLNSFLAIAGVPQSPFVSGTVTLTLYIAGYVAEVVTAGIQAVPRITRRAARGLGMTYLQDFRYIVLPIGAKAVFPSWVGLMLGLMKDTSLIAVLSATPPELLRSSQIIINRVQEPLLIFLGAGAFYFLLCYPLSRLAGRLELRWLKQQEPIQ